MESPVVVENFASIPIRGKHTNGGNYPPEPMEVDNSGFPFDEADFGRSDASLKSHLDDLAKRHPEIAQHFNKEFPFRSNTWGHKRRGSSSGKDEPKPSFPTDDFPDLKRFTDRPFGSRFERFGFPFNRTFDDDPHFRQPSNQQPSGSSQGQPQTSNPTPPPQPSTSSNEPQPSESKTQESFDKPPQVPNQDRGRKQYPYVQQSNTTDLGQKQEAVNEPRGQRSMSAPPENRSNHPRYVSSINIPVNVERGGNGMGSQQSQQQPPQQQQSQPSNQSQNQQSTHERVIPIMVEGRDEPVIPRNVHPTFSSPPKPEPERVFAGARPSQFAGWPRNESHFYRNDPYFQQPPSYQHHQQQPQSQHNKPTEEPFKQHAPPQHHASAPPPPQPQQQSRQPTPPKQEQAHSPSPPPSKPQGKLTPVEQIEAIQKDVADLMTQIENFGGKTKDKQYLYLDEMLTRNLIKLDDVQTEGQEELRQMRKEAIRSVQRCISVLESKVSSEKREDVMDVEQNKNETNKPSEEQAMEVEKTDQNENSSNEPADKEQQNVSNQEQNKVNEDLTRSGSGVKTGEDKKEGSPMDVNAGPDAKPKTEEKNTDNKQESGDTNIEEKKQEPAQDNAEVKESKDKKEEKKDKKKVKKKEKSEKK